MKRKQPFVILAAALLVFVISCKKQQNPRICCTANIPAGSIFGNWNLVGDTTYAGVNTGAEPVIYKGQPGDHFFFATDGHIYVREGAVSDTLNYKLVSPGQISITSFTAITRSSADTCQIATFTSGSLVIISPLFAIPAGPQQRMVGLAR